VTRFDVFVRGCGVRASVYARRAGISGSQLRRFRRGESEPTRRLMVALTETASAMLSRPVRMVELFELSRADEAVYLAILKRRNKP
jgi:transcriptional regulator with XRE-family HTH domain